MNKDEKNGGVHLLLPMRCLRAVVYDEAGTASGHH
jgi:hypothetical protein